MNLATVSTWFNRAAPLIYICVTLPTVLFHSFALPPFQAPDEINHFLRVVQLSQGQLIGERFSKVSAGGTLDVRIAELARSFDYLKFHPEVKIDLRAFQTIRTARWDNPKPEFVDFGNTVIYPPFFYLPAIAAVSTAKALNLTVIDSLYVARLLTGVIAVLIGSLALALTTYGRAFLFVILSLPMVIGLYASASQDGLMIAATALTVAAFCRTTITRNQDLPWWFFLLSALVGVIVAAKISYLPVLFLLPLCAVRNPKPHLPVKVLLAGLFVAALPIVATFVLIASVKVPFRANEGVSIPGQLLFLWQQPSAIPVIVKNTFTMYWKQHLMELIGKFGWLDTELPARVYIVAAITTLLACAMHLVIGSYRRRWVCHVVPVAITISAIALTYVVLYLSWSPVGLLFVDGVQGRYWIPPLLILSLALPRLAPLHLGPRSSSHNFALIVGWVVIYCFAASNLWSIPRAILTRYYA